MGTSRTNLRLVAPMGIKIPCNTGTAACQGRGYKVQNWVNNLSLRYAAVNITQYHFHSDEREIS